MANPEINRAIEAIESGRVAEGRFLLETLVPEFLDDPDVCDRACWLARALVMSEEPDTEGALEVLGEALRSYPRSSRLHVHKGLVLCEAMRHEEAERSFAAAVRSDPDNWEAHLNRGILREQLGKFPQALRSYQVAASRAGDRSGEPLVRTAWLQKRLGRTDEARDALRRYLSIEEDDAQEWVSLAILESDQGRWSAAEEAYQRALSIDPGHVSALFNLVVTYQRQGRRDDMARTLQVMETRCPRDRRTAWAKGIVLAEDARPDEATLILEGVFRRALCVDDLGSGELGALAAWVFPLLARCGSRVRARRLLHDAFAAFLFEPALLDAWLSSFGRRCPGASRYVLTVDASDPDAMPDENGIPRQWRYLRRYEVQATSLDEAWRLALEAEAVIGGEDLKRGEVLETREQAGEVPIGLLYMSEGSAYLEESV